MKLKKKLLQCMCTTGTILIWVMVLSLFLLSSCPKPKVYKIGVLSGLNFIAGITDGFKEAMTELGYIEGKNIIYDVQKTDFDIDAYKKILNKFVADKVDLIFTFPTEATLEAKNVTMGTNIPVVFNFCFIEGMDIIKTVREPGGNITGIRYPGPDIAVKRFEIMQSLVPTAKRYLIPYQKGYPIVQSQLEAIKPGAAAAGITLIEAPAADTAEIETLLNAQVIDAKPVFDVIMFLAEPLTVTPEPFEALAKFAYTYSIPIGGAYMKVGGYASIFGINVDIVKSGRQAAPQADKILKGEKAGTIPVLSADNFLQIDINAAQKLGVKVPDTLLKQAAEVIR